MRPERSITVQKMEGLDTGSQPSGRERVKASMYAR